MFQHVDEAIRKLLFEFLSDEKDLGIHNLSQMTFSAPYTAESEKHKEPRINLYLYNLYENTEMREESLSENRNRREEDAVVRRGPSYVNLNYLVTVHCNDAPEKEHSLLASVLRIFFRFHQAPLKYLEGELAEEQNRLLYLSVSQPTHRTQNELVGIWQSLGGRIRPTISLVATVRIHPFEPRIVKVVREILLGMGVGTPPNGPKRPLDMRSVRVGAAGIVSDHGGNPLEGVFVGVDGLPEKTVTDERGFFYFLNLPTGKNQLVFSKKGFQSQTKESIAPALGRSDQLEPLAITMVELSDKERVAEEKALLTRAANSPELVECDRSYAVSVIGRLRHEDGRPAAYTVVCADGRRTTTDADGVYHFFDLPSTKVNLVAEIPGVGEVPIKQDGATAEKAVPDGTAKKRR